MEWAGFRANVDAEVEKLSSWIDGVCQCMCLYKNVIVSKSSGYGHTTLKTPVLV